MAAHSFSVNKDFPTQAAERAYHHPDQFRHLDDRTVGSRGDAIVWQMPGYAKRHHHRERGLVPVVLVVLWHFTD
jgi:hypothetical protein